MNQFETASFDALNSDELVAGALRKIKARVAKRVESAKKFRNPNTLPKDKDVKSVYDNPDDKKISALIDQNVKYWQEQAFNTWQNAVLSAGSEVSNALVLYNSSDEKSKLEEKQVASLKKNVEYNKMLFNDGSATYLEVITAQQSLLNAELSKVADDFYKMQAVVNLYYALGGGRY